MIKYAIVFVLSLSSAAPLNSQNPARNAAIPAQVLQSFDRNFPEADTAIWSLANNICLARFSIGQTAMTAQLDTCGNVREYCKKIRFKDLPEPLRVAFARDRYNRYQIAEVFDVNQPGGTPARYFVIMGQTANSLTPLRFTANGEVVVPRPRRPCTH